MSSDYSLGGLTITSQMSSDKQAEIQRLKNEMADNKENAKEEEEND